MTATPMRCSAILRNKGIHTTIVNAPELTTRKCGVSLDTVSRIEDGESIPSLHVADGGANQRSPTF